MAKITVTWDSERPVKKAGDLMDKRPPLYWRLHQARTVTFFGYII